MTKKEMLIKAKSYISEYHIDLTKFKLSDSAIDYDAWNRENKTYYFTFESKTNEGIRVHIWIEQLGNIEGYYKISLG